jgi:hypothetical protein
MPLYILSSRLDASRNSFERFGKAVNLLLIPGIELRFLLFPTLSECAVPSYVREEL